MAPTSEGAQLYGLRAFESKQFDSQRCEVKILDDFHAAGALTFGEIYKVVSYFQDSSCGLRVDSTAPSTLLSSLFFDEYVDTLRINPYDTTLIPLFKGAVVAANPATRVGEIFQVGPVEAWTLVGVVQNASDPRAFYTQQFSVGWTHSRGSTTRTIRSPGFVEFRAGQLGAGLVCGLSSRPTEGGDALKALDYGIQLGADGKILLVERGVPRDPEEPTLYTADDVFRILYTGSSVVYSVRQASPSAASPNQARRILGTGAASTPAEFAALFSMLQPGTTIQSVDLVELAQLRDSNVIYYETTYTEVDAENNFVRFNGRDNPALLRAEFKRLGGLSAPPTVTNIQLSLEDIKLTPFEDPVPISFPDPFETINEYKRLEFRFFKVRAADEPNVQLLRLQLFQDQTPLATSEYKVLWNGQEVPGLTGTDPVDIPDPAAEIAWEAPLPASLVVVNSKGGFLKANGYSFMVGGELDKQPLQWTMRGSATGVLWKPMTEQLTDATYKQGYYTRLPISPFKGRSRIALPPNMRTYPLLANCPSIKIGDLQFLQDAATVIYEQLSRFVPGYVEAEKRKGRAYLKSIAQIGIAQNEPAVVIYIRPEVSVIDSNFFRYEIASGSQLLVLLRYSLTTDCQLTFLPARSGVLLGATSARVPASVKMESYPVDAGIPATPADAIKIPLGWKGRGLEPVLAQSFREIGAWAVKPGGVFHSTATAPVPTFEGKPQMIGPIPDHPPFPEHRGPGSCLSGLRRLCGIHDRGCGTNRIPRNPARNP